MRNVRLPQTLLCARASTQQRQNQRGGCASQYANLLPGSPGFYHKLLRSPAPPKVCNSPAPCDISRSPGPLAPWAHCAKRRPLIMNPHASPSCGAKPSASAQCERVTSPAEARELSGKLRSGSFLPLANPLAGAGALNVSAQSPSEPLSFPGGLRRSVRTRAQRSFRLGVIFMACTQTRRQRRSFFTRMVTQLPMQILQLIMQGETCQAKHVCCHLI